MNIIFDRPPNFDDIDAAFHVAGKPVIFAWGDVIYNPQRVNIRPELMAHEAMHGERQIQWGIEQWWKDYISSDAFRLEEEILAHQVEYRCLLRGIASNRQARRGALKHVAKRLAAPLYGRMLSLPAARRMLAEAAI